ncbi:MAG: hypothetical protein ACQEVA_08495 [Myxococcota bacterium]
MDEQDNAPDFPGSSGQPPRPQSPEPRQTRRSATVEDAFGATKRFFLENQSLTIQVFGLYAALLLIGSMLGVVVSMVTGMAELQIQQMNMSPEQAGDPQVAMEMLTKSWPSLVVSLGYGLVANGFYAATFKPARAALFSDSTPSFAVAAGQLGQAVGKGMLSVIVFGLIVGFGLLFCILPGVIALFFLVPYFYLVCGKGENVIDGVSTSFGWAKDNVGIVATVFIAQIVMFFSAGCVQSVASQPILEAMGQTGLFVTSGISWFVMTVTSFPVWLLMVGSMGAIESAESA